MNRTFFTPQIEEKARRNPPRYLADLRRCAVLVTEHAMEFDTASPCWAALHRKYPVGGRRSTPRTITPKVPIVASGCNGCAGVTGKRVEL